MVAAYWLPALLDGEAKLGQAPPEQRLRPGQRRIARGALKGETVEQGDQPLVEPIATERCRQRHYDTPARTQHAPQLGQCRRVDDVLGREGGDDRVERGRKRR